MFIKTTVDNSSLSIAHRCWR